MLKECRLDLGNPEPQQSMKQLLLLIRVLNQRRKLQRPKQWFRQLKTHKILSQHQSQRKLGRLKRSISLQREVARIKRNDLR